MSVIQCIVIIYPLLSKLKTKAVSSLEDVKSADIESPDRHSTMALSPNSSYESMDWVVKYRNNAIRTGNIGASQDYRAAPFPRMSRCVSLDDLTDRQVPPLPNWQAHPNHTLPTAALPTQPPPLPNQRETVPRKSRHGPPLPPKPEWMTVQQ